VTRQGLRLILTLLGAVAITFGMLGVLMGGDGVLHGGDVSANIDTEARFFAAWYVGGGLFMLRAARRLDTEGTTIRIICAVWFLAACGRALSIVTKGAPNALFIVLMVVEFAIPLVVLPWHAAVSRHSKN
jgi:hypothetical protein